MDRKPKRAPFAAGTRLRCLGNRKGSRVTVLDNLTGSEALIYGEGLEVTICAVRFGRQGTLRHLREEDGSLMYDDLGDPVLDRTHDWCSVYEVIGTNGQRHGRLIYPENRKEWERIK